MLLTLLRRLSLHRPSHNFNSIVKRVTIFYQFLLCSNFQSFAEIDHFPIPFHFTSSNKQIKYSCLNHRYSEQRIMALNGHCKRERWNGRRIRVYLCVIFLVVMDDESIDFPFLFWTRQNETRNRGTETQQLRQRSLKIQRKNENYNSHAFTWQCHIFSLRLCRDIFHIFSIYFPLFARILWSSIDRRWDKTRRGENIACEKNKSRAHVNDCGFDVVVCKCAAAQTRKFSLSFNKFRESFADVVFEKCPHRQHKPFQWKIDITIRSFQRTTMAHLANLPQHWIFHFSVRFDSRCAQQSGKTKRKKNCERNRHSLPRIFRLRQSYFSSCRATNLCQNKMFFFFAVFSVHFHCAQNTKSNRISMFCRYDSLLPCKMNGKKLKIGDGDDGHDESEKDSLFCAHIFHVMAFKVITKPN